MKMTIFTFALILASMIFGAIKVSAAVGDVRSMVNTSGSFDVTCSNGDSEVVSESDILANAVSRNGSIKYCLDQ